MQSRAGGSTGSRAPQIFNEDLHVEISGAQAVRNRLDPDLEQERSYSFTLGWDLEKYIGSWQTYFMVEGFYTRITDPFFTQYTEDPEQAGHYIFWKSNSSFDQVVQGVNIETKIAPSPKLSLQSGITIQTAEYTDENPWGDEEESVSDKILRTPDFYGSLSLNYMPTSKIMISTTGIYTGSMYVPHLAGGYTNGELNQTERLEESDSFMDVSVKASYDFSLSEDMTLQLGLGVKNILDSYQDQFDAGIGRDAGYTYGPGNPRMYFIELKIGNLW